jgi:hypothetical protein
MSQDRLIANCDNTASAFSGTKLVRVFTTSVNPGARPDAIVAGPNDKIFTGNFGVGSANVRSATDDRYVGQVRGAGYTWAMACDPAIERVLETNFGDGINLISPRTDSIVGSFPLAAAGDLGYLGYSPADRLIFVSGCFGPLYAVTNEGALRGAPLLSHAVAAGMTYDPRNGNMYVVDERGILWVVH